MQTTSSDTETGITGTVSNRYYLNPDNTISIETTTIISHNIPQNYGNSMSALEDIISLTNQITENNYRNTILNFMRELGTIGTSPQKEIIFDEKKFSDLKEVDDTCPICLEKFKDEENVAVLECGHLYHPNCIKKWGKQKPSCPMCKKEIKTR